MALENIFENKLVANCTSFILAVILAVSFTEIVCATLKSSDLFYLISVVLTLAKINPGAHWTMDM